MVPVVTPALSAKFAPLIAVNFVTGAFCQTASSATASSFGGTSAFVAVTTIGFIGDCVWASTEPDARHSGTAVAAASRIRMLRAPWLRLWSVHVPAGGHHPEQACHRGAGSSEIDVHQHEQDDHQSNE